MSTHYQRGTGSLIWNKEDHDGDTGKLLKLCYSLDVDLIHAKVISRADFFNNAARRVGKQQAKLDVNVVPEAEAQKYVTKMIKVVSCDASWRIVLKLTH